MPSSYLHQIYSKKWRSECVCERQAVLRSALTTIVFVHRPRDFHRFCAIVIPSAVGTRIELYSAGLASLRLNSPMMLIIHGSIPCPPRMSPHSAPNRNVLSPTIRPPRRTFFSAQSRYLM